MRIEKFRAWLLSNATALSALWLAMPIVVQAKAFRSAVEMPMHCAMHAHGGMPTRASTQVHHSGMRVHHVPSMTSIGGHTAAAYGDGLASSGDDGCCGFSMFGCCAPCFLLPAEPETALEDSGRIAFGINAEAADGIPAARLKRPPRFAL
jgi:hypothetical protein